MNEKSIYSYLGPNPVVPAYQLAERDRPIHRLAVSSFAFAVANQEVGAEMSEFVEAIGRCSRG